MNIKPLLNLINNVLCSKNRLFILIIFIFLIESFFIPISFSLKIDQDYKQSKITNEGQFLFSPMWTTTTSLIESDGDLNHTWYSIYFPGVSVWWLGDGMILRTIRTDLGPGTGGTGGGVQKVDWDGDVVWDFRYNTNGVLSHHDVKTLPNGNVLLIAWETKTRAEAIAAGRNPNYVTNLGLMPDHIIEVKPTGETSGEIVWEWHVWDHLIQDYNIFKSNYGIVKNHPELVDINYRTSQQQDIMHTNSIDYNEEFDQILLSVCYYNEIWVIDHSTTTEEAAGHAGGNSGKGGDLLYRWGNPQTYDAGTSDDQKFFMQHDATWIKPGYPSEGNILVFNNGVGRSDGKYSSVDEIVPPVNEIGEYYLEEGSAYGPEAQTWIYTANPTKSFYSYHFGGAYRLPNGNTLITNGDLGKLFEVTPNGSIVWQYNSTGKIFKAVYIPAKAQEPPEPNGPDLYCSGSLSWANIKPGSIVYGSFQVKNIGDSGSLLNWTINRSFINWGTWTFTPESEEGLTPEDGEVTVQVSVVVPNEKKSKFVGYIRIENQNNTNDYELIKVNLITPLDNNSIITMIYQFLIKLLKNLS